jgi:hypothetical protein
MEIIIYAVGLWVGAVLLSAIAAKTITVFSDCENDHRNR